ISTANGMWYQRLSKLKIPLSKACFVVTAQLNTVIEITAAITSNKTGDSGPAGPVTAGDPPPLPVAKASSGGVPPTVPPPGRSQKARPSRTEAAIKVPA